MTSWGGASGRLDLLWVLWALARGGWGGCVVALHEPLRFEYVCACAGGWFVCRVVGAVSIEGGMGHGSWIATRRGVLGAAWRKALVGCVMEIVMLF